MLEGIQPDSAGTKGLELTRTGAADMLQLVRLPSRHMGYRLFQRQGNTFDYRLGGIGQVLLQI